MKLRFDTILIIIALVCTVLICGCEKEEAKADRITHYGNITYLQDEGWPFVMQLRNGKYCAFQDAWEEGMGSGCYTIEEGSLTINGGMMLDVYTHKWLYDTILPGLHGCHSYCFVHDSLMIYSDSVALLFLDKDRYTGINVDSLYGNRQYYESRSTNAASGQELENKSFVLLQYEKVA